MAHWWEDTKDWVVWTIRDELYYGLIKPLVGKAVIGLVLAVALAIFGYAKSHPMILVSAASVAVTCMVILGTHFVPMLVGAAPQGHFQAPAEPAPAAPRSEFTLRDRVGLGFAFGNNRVEILIPNQDRQAEYFGVFSISGGPVDADRTSELFCQWTHTDSIRAKIARSQPCRIILAHMETESPTPRTLTTRWVIHTATEKGPQEIKAAYCSSTEPLAYAPDIVLSGAIFRDPDDPDGPQPFRVVLHGFGAALE